MTDYLRKETSSVQVFGPVTVYQGDVRGVLSQLPSESVQCCVTSPPYWGLRDYGVAGQLGLEATPDEYVCAMVEVFREMRRVLRKDGTLWVNLGDSYAGSRGAQGHRETPATLSRNQITNHPKRASLTGKIIQAGLKPKDLVGIPWRVAFALQADGWYLRSDIIWSKPNPMPESVTDRPTKAHEYLFLLTRSPRYYYDAAAIRTAFSPETKALSFETMDFARRDTYKAGKKIKMPDGWDTGPGGHGSFHRNGREKGVTSEKQRGHERPHEGFNATWDGMSKAEQIAGGANARTVWTIATQAYPDAHFATFPEDLVVPCIKAGSREGDVVLDPFAGSGTTLAVARRLSRKAIGIELQAAYLPLIEKRVSEAALPLLEAI